MNARPRVLVLGAGYLAGHIGRTLVGSGHAVTVSSRRRPALPEGLAWLPVDVRELGAVRAAIDAVRPEAVVSVHGPSDITGCEADPGRAVAAHREGARHLAEAVRGRRVLLVSTDNVFAGEKDSHAESDPTAPANAYGRAKRTAEEILLGTGNCLVLRVSLVYGWDLAGLRPNFFTTCARTLGAGRPVAVPDDLWNTPVLVDDAAAWTAALLDSAHTGVVHLGGPRRLSRFAWATHIALGHGVDPALVTPVPREGTAYACRPRNACLHSERAGRLPELTGLSPTDVLDASTRLISDAKDRP
ncbi:SDR family oxidoreductase [Streptomyces capparidis]